MSTGPIFPALMKLDYQRDDSVKSRFIADIDAMTDAGRRKFEDFGKEASRQLDAALSVKRNVSGSLDLGVTELKAAAAAQQARATAAREVATATRIAAQAEGDYSQQARLAIAATESLANEEEQAARAARSHAAAAEQVQSALNRQVSGTQAVVSATRTGTTANRLLANSTAAVRTATIQAGQQFQDIAISIYSGQRAAVVFAQQLPQLAFAMTSLEGNANKTLNRLGQMGTFLSGPMGVAVGLAVGAVGTYVAGLISASGASEDLKKKTISLSDALGSLKTAHEEATKAIDEYNDAQDRERDNAERMIKLNLASAEARLKDALATRQQLAANLALNNEALEAGAGDAESLVGLQYAQRRGVGKVTANDAEIARLNKLVTNLSIQDAERTAEAASDPIKRINDQYDDMRDAAKAASAGNDLLAKSIGGVLVQLEKSRAADLEAQRASTRKTVERLEPVTMQEVAGLIGAPITSGRRSAAKNKSVGGARNSYHTIGQAIDIPLTVNGKPLTKEGIRAALEPAGVVIKELLGPGDKGHDDHFHVAFDKKRGAPDQMAKAAEAAATKYRALKEWGDSAGDSIQRLSDRFSDQPKLISQVEAAVDNLDDIIRQLGDRKPPGFEKMIADAERAKQVVEDAIGKPFRDYIQDQERSVKIQELILAGRENEARALQQIYALYDKVGVVTEEQRTTILANVEAEERLNEALQARQEIISAYSSSISSVRSDLEGLLGQSLSGGDFLKNLKRNFQQLQGKLLTEQLFGPMLRGLEKSIRESTGIKSSVDIMKEGTESAGKAADTMATALERAASRVDKLFQGNGLSAGDLVDGAAAGLKAANPDALLASLATEFRVAANDNAGSVTSENGEIVVTANKKMANGVAGMGTTEYAELLGKAITAPLGKELSGLGGIFGTAMMGYATGGVPGGILGGLKGLTDQFGKDVFGDKLAGEIGGKLGDAMKGAAVGTMVNGLAKAVGFNKFSKTGAQIGGAAGSFLPIPGGQVIGSIVGGIIGGLLKKTKKGVATIGGSGDDATVSLSGNSGSRKKAAGAAADSVESAIADLAEALGGSVDYASGSVSIGVRDKKYRVDPTGRGMTKLKNGAIDFGDDQEAAIAYAVQNLIQDGVIKGLRQSTLNILKSGKDLQKAIEDAVAFESVFKELRRMKDPVGAAIDDLNTEFQKLILIFQQAGASAEEFAQLQELYDLKRAEAIKQATDAAISSLKDLYDFLKTGDTGKSLRERNSELGSRYQELKGRVLAGDTTANDEFAQVSRDYLEVQRQLYGSQEEYFKTLDEVTAVTKQALDAQKAQAAAAANADSPFSGSTVPAADNTNVVAAVDKLGTTVTDQVAYKIDATNANLATTNSQLSTLVGLQRQQLLAIQQLRQGNGTF